MDFTNYLLTQLKALTSIGSPSGFTKQAVKYVFDELKGLGYSPEITVKGGIICCIGGENNPILLTGHLDTLGGMVSEIKSNGRLRISPIGGLKINNTEGENCTIYTRSNESYSGTFQLDNPSVHVNKDYSTIERSYSNMEVVIDEKVCTKEDTKNLNIEVGDYVCFDPRTVITQSGYIKSRFLDDKLSVAILLCYAKKLKDENRIPNRKVYLHITVYEEVGHGGCGSIPADVVEVLGVDMGCVGDTLQCDEHMVSICAKDSKGPSNYEITTALINTAKENNLNYAVDIYPYYGSDADAALTAGYDIKHCLIGAGVYASHGYERSHIDGASNTLLLIDKYIG